MNLPEINLILRDLLFENWNVAITCMISLITQEKSQQRQIFGIYELGTSLNAKR